jgi:hypothetical protein
MEVNDHQRASLALPPEKSTGTNWVDPKDGLDILKKREKYFADPSGCEV